MLTTTLFAKTIINLIQTKRNLCSGDYILDKFKVNWFERIDYSNEKFIGQCEMGSDGFWMSIDKDCTDGKSHGYSHRSKFYWRIEPNYCCEGRPCFSSERIAEIFKKSETQKVIYELNNLKICLEWFGFNLPTKTCWGLSMKPTHVTVYHKGSLVFTSLPMVGGKWKKEFIEFIQNY